MPDMVVFIFGSIVFLMVSFGLGFTVLEVRRINNEAIDRQEVRSRNKVAG